MMPMRNASFTPELCVHRYEWILFRCLAFQDGRCFQSVVCPYVILKPIDNGALDIHYQTSETEFYFSSE